MKRKRSCPFCAEISAEARGLIPAMPMLSTVTSVSFFLPHSTAYFLLNHSSYAGTKWTHWRIRSFFAAWARPGMMMLAPSPAATAPAPVALRNCRLSTASFMDCPSCRREQ